MRPCNYVTVGLIKPDVLFILSRGKGPFAFPPSFFRNPVPASPPHPHLLLPVPCSRTPVAVLIFSDPLFPFLYPAGEKFSPDLPVPFGHYAGRHTVYFSAPDFPSCVVSLSVLFPPPRTDQDTHFFTQVLWVPRLP